MRKFYYLLTLLAGTFIFAQQPIITMISDGDCSGGTPKVIEIYANGAVDFSQFSVELQTNANTTWTNTQDLSSFGTVTDDFIYLYNEGNNPGVFSTEYPNISNAITSSACNFNGDDRIRIIETATMTVIDIYGEDGVDGSGSFWEYTDGFANRVSGMGPNSTFTASEWTFSNGALNGLGLCQGGTETFEVLTNTGNYTTSVSNDPTVTIISPSNGQTLPAGTTEYEVNYSVTNFNVPTDGHLHYFLNGNMTMQTNLDPIMLTGLTPQTYTFKLQLVDTSHQPLNPDVSSEITFTIPSATNVANIGELRSQTDDGSTLYVLDSEVFINYAQSYRNQKFIQDDTAGILIDDTAGLVSGGSRGDGLTALQGTLSTYNGMLQFVPTANATVVSPSTLTIAPQSVTLADLTANFEDYEAELVTIEPVTFDTQAESNFVNGTNYTMTATAGADTFDFYTTFYNVDYTDQPINPAGYEVITCLPFERADGPKVVARDLADMVALGVEDVSNLEDSVQFSNTLVSNDFKIYLNGEAKIELFSLNGQLMKSLKGSDVITINTSHLNQGVYLVRITQNAQTLTKKIIKK